jgi:hypothetical protein
MSELAFDREGNPFRFSRRTKKLRPRRWKNAGQRGTCAAVLDADGDQVLLDADAEYMEFRATVGNVPGFYRLDQCDEDGALLEDAAPAYVSIAPTRNVAPSGEGDPRDAIIRDLAQINADVVRTIAERFGNVMQAAADILRAADGAGMSRRQPPPAPPAPEDEEDGEDEEDKEEKEPAAPASPFGPVQPFVEMAMPHLPKFGAFLWVKFQEFMRQTATPPAAPASAPPAVPNAAPASGDVAVGHCAPIVAAAPVAAPAPVVAPGPVAAPPPVVTLGPVAAPPPVVTLGPVAAPAPVVAPTPVVASALVAGPALVLATSSPTVPSASLPSALVPATPASSMLDSAAPSEVPNAAAISGAMSAGPAQADGPCNAPSTIEPTPEQWQHLLAIRARLSPREAVIAETVVTRMDPETLAQWLAELSMLSVDQAAELLRSMIPKRPPKAAPARNDAKEEGAASPPGARPVVAGPPDKGSSP